MPARRSVRQHIANRAGILSRFIWVDAQHHQPVQIAHISFRQQVAVLRKLVDLLQCREVIDRFQMILERLSVDGDPVLDDKRRLYGSKGGAFMALDV
jgi:hypothetical protein